MGGPGSGRKKSNNNSMNSELKKQRKALSKTSTDAGIDPRTGKTRKIRSFNENKYK